MSHFYYYNHCRFESQDSPSALEAQIEQEMGELEGLLGESALRLDSGRAKSAAAASASSVRNYRRVLHWLAQFCRTDLVHASDQHQADDHQEPTTTTKTKTTTTTTPTRPQDHSNARARPVWPLLMIVYYLFTCARASANIYYQYVHDINLYRSRTLQQAARKQDMSQSRTTTSPPPPPSASWDAALIEARIRESRAMLDTLGAPFANMSFFVQILYVYIYLLTFIIFLMGPLCFGRDTIDFRFAWVLLAPASARRRCLALASAELRRLLVSSRLFEWAKSSSCCWPPVAVDLAPSAGAMRPPHPAGGPAERAAHHWQQQQQLDAADQLGALGLEFAAAAAAGSSPASSEPAASLAAAAAAAAARPVELIAPETLRRQLRAVVSRASFLALSWSRHPIEARSALHLRITLSCLLAGLTLMSFSILTMPLNGDLGAHAYDLADYWMLADNGFAALALIIAGSFYSSIVCVSCADQIHHISAVRRLIDACRLENQLSHHRGLDGDYDDDDDDEASAPAWPAASGRRHAQLRSLERMNANLLAAYLQFRLLVDQLKREVASYGIFALIALVVISSLPLIVALHAAYLSPTVRLIQFCFFPGTWFFLDFTTVPICLVHNRTLDLYRSLAQLLARTVETSTLRRSLRAPTAPVGRTTAAAAQPVGPLHLYDAHLVWLLRRELSYPEIFLRQFATEILGIKFTFQTLIKIHFWLGVLALYFLNGVTSFADGGGGGGGGGGTGAGGWGAGASLGGFLGDPFGVLHVS